MGKNYSNIFYFNFVSLNDYIENLKKVSWLKLNDYIENDYIETWKRYP